MKIIKFEKSVDRSTVIIKIIWIILVTMFGFLGVYYFLIGVSTHVDILQIKGIAYMFVSDKLLEDVK